MDGKLTVCECACSCCEERRVPVKLGLVAAYPTGEIEPRALDLALTPTERRILVLAFMAHPGQFDPRPGLGSYSLDLGNLNRHAANVQVARLRHKIGFYGLTLICHGWGARYHLEEAEAT